MFGVWPLRILIRSVLDFWRFIVCDLSDLHKPLRAEVQSRLHHFEHLSELLEVVPLRAA